MKKKNVQKKKLIDVKSETNIKTVVEEHIPSENVHSAGRRYEAASLCLKNCRENWSCLRSSFTRGV